MSADFELTWQTVSAMADVIARADTGKNLDALPSWERDQYRHLGEAVLRHVAEVEGRQAMVPVYGIGWHPKRRQVVVGDPSDDAPPAKCEPVFRRADS